MTTPLYQSGQQAQASLTGSELVSVDAGGAVVSTATTQQIANLAGTGSSTVITNLNTVGNGTITAPGLVGKVTVRGGNQNNAAFTDTMPTAAQLLAALVNPKIGQSWEWQYQNTTNANATLASSASVTVSGITTVYGKTSARFLVTYSGAGAFTVVGISQNAPLGASGTFVANGATPVVVADTRVTANSIISFSLKTVGGTVSPNALNVLTVTPGTGFTVGGTALDTSTYNYQING